MKKFVYFSKVFNLFSNNIDVFYYSFLITNTATGASWGLKLKSIWGPPHSQRFTDLGNLNLLMVVRFQARANFCYCHSCLKNEAWFKSGQKWLENNCLASLISNRNTLSIRLLWATHWGTKKASQPFHRQLWSSRFKKACNDLTKQYISLETCFFSIATVSSSVKKEERIYVEKRGKRKK